jgi:hypothetical protein
VSGKPRFTAICTGGDLTKLRRIRTHAYAELPAMEAIYIGPKFVCMHDFGPGAEGGGS